MKTEKIVHNGVVLAIVLRDKEWKKGLNFISAESDFQQVGVWEYEKGKILSPHIHLPAPRTITHTQEVLFIKSGRLKADIFTPAKHLLISLILEKGDIIILLQGGHGYEILDEHTCVLEVKNGPYIGPEKDRERI